MSIAEIERFAADLQSNAALKAEAQKAQADKSHANPMDRAVAFGASKGYAFTADEAKAHATAKAKADGKVLTDAELDGVAGGDWRDGGVIGQIIISLDPVAKDTTNAHYTMDTPIRFIPPSS